MTCTQEPAPMDLEFNVDFTLDVRDIQTPVGGAAFEAIPSIQLAAVRTDRPDAGAIISGTPLSTATATHYVATLSAGAYFWFRRGLAYRLTVGRRRRRRRMHHLGRGVPDFGHPVDR